ncbi:unnamed protein product [Ceutorhynchus assimilis]|uniref:Gustatory receptor n=1 Tax=Ceutorhynchus assimilis TaxID=467358 RepID=A0A9N9MRR3_9CUCU|nr:unnamed protein product [Ceutorhynchus assimilis]
MVLIHDMSASIRKYPQSVYDAIQDYFVRKEDEIFSYVPYSIWTGLAFQVSDENLWRVIREDYAKLCRLCALINTQLSWFIITSFFTNLYHILTQLFTSLRPIEDTFHKVYFYVSFFLLILRVTTVCIFGGAVYDEHEQITGILTTVPSPCYNIEVERFVMHLSTSEMALSGKGFFKITRNLILKVSLFYKKYAILFSLSKFQVMSAIVTYELVLIQFNQQEFKTKDL